METLIKCGGWIALLIGTVITILILKKMEEDREKRNKKK